MKKLQFTLMLVIFTASIFLTGCYSCRSCNSMWGNGKRSDYPPNTFFWDKGCKKLCDAPNGQSCACGINNVQTVYSYGNCGIIKLQEILPHEVTVDTEFTFTVNVINLTNTTVKNVVVSEAMPENFQYIGSSPAATANGQRLEWTIDQIPPHGVTVINVTGTATSTNCLQVCGTVLNVAPTRAANNWD
jgi:uncharacterized repeat protein (TIGR01451 family)